MSFITIRLMNYTRRFDKDNLYVKRSQLNFEGKDLIDNLPSTCIDCKENEEYKIWIQEIRGLGSQASYGKEKVYWARCTKCSDSFEILFSDYMKILPFIKLNIKLSEKKISLDDYQRKTDKIKFKLFKKIR